ALRPGIIRERIKLGCFMTYQGDIVKDCSYPRKVNVGVWRVALNCLATPDNLIQMGIVIASRSFPLCGVIDGDVHHILIYCSRVMSVWSWWKFDSPVSFPSFGIRDVAFRINSRQTQSILLVVLDLDPRLLNVLFLLAQKLKIRTSIRPSSGIRAIWSTLPKKTKLKIYEDYFSTHKTYQAEEEPANFALMVIPSSSSFDNELSPAKPAEDLSHTNRPSAPIIEEWKNGFLILRMILRQQPYRLLIVLFSPLTATPKPTSPKTSSSGKRKNRKTCFVCRSVDHLIKDCNFHAKLKSQPTPRNNAHRGYNKQHASFTKKFPQKYIVPAAVLLKSKPISVTAVRPICADVPKIMMTRPKHAHSLNTRSNSTIRRHKTCSYSSNTSNLSPKVTAAKAPVVSAAKGEESVIRDPEEESSEKTPTETKSKNKGKGILVEEPKPIKKKQQVEMEEDHELAARLRAKEQR
nr:hypothetical protein [Tanacetum cinerariifolium]